MRDSGGRLVISFLSGSWWKGRLLDWRNGLLGLFLFNNRLKGGLAKWRARSNDGCSTALHIMGAIVVQCRPAFGSQIYSGLFVAVEARVFPVASVFLFVLDAISKNQHVFTFRLSVSNLGAARSHITLSAPLPSCM